MQRYKMLYLYCQKKRGRFYFGVAKHSYETEDNRNTARLIFRISTLCVRSSTVKAGI